MKIEESVVTTLRALKGAPLSIFTALSFASEPLNSKELEAITDYSGKTVQKGIDTLIMCGLAEKIGRYGGIKITEKAAHHPLFPHNRAGKIPAQQSTDSTPVDKRDGKFPAQQSTDSPPVDKRDGKFPAPEIRSDSYPQPVDKRDGKFTAPDDGETENFRLPPNRAGKIPAPPPNININNSSSLDLNKKNKEIPTAATHKEKFLAQHAPSTELKEIWRLLVNAGVDRYSPKMREILALDPSLDFIQAHNQAVEDHADMNLRYPINHYITNIINGANPPQLPTCQHIPDRYQDLVMR